MKTAYINHTDVDFPEDTALYLAQNKLAGMHYQELPVTTCTEEYDGYSGESTFDSFHKYATDPHVIGVRNNAHPELKGGMMVGSVVPPNNETAPQTPMGIVVTLADPDGIDDSDKDLYARLEQIAPDIGPERCDSVLADIPLEPGLKGKDILETVRSENSVDEDVFQFLSGLVGAMDGKRTFDAFGESFEVDDEDEDIEVLTVLQVVRMNPESTEWVWYRDYPLFASINHRGTTNDWDTGSEQLLAAFLRGESRVAIKDESKKSEASLDDIDTDIGDLISDDELETLCSEFLRQNLFKPLDEIDVDPYEEYVHTYPVGGSLQSVDIVAEDLESERIILAQVTFDSAASSKVEDLVSAVGDHHEDPDSIDAWFFGEDAKEAVEGSDSGVPYAVDIAEVQQSFKKCTERTVLEAILDVESDPDPPSVLQGAESW